MARLLIVEDDVSLRENLVRMLQLKGHECLCCESFTNAAAEASTAAPDCILLDLSLPGAYGHEICRAIRQESNVPIIVLTSSDSEFDEVMSMNVGADDYITKPFDPVEVLARVRSQLRRYTQLGSKKEEEKPNVYTVGPIVLDEEKKSVTVAGDEVALTPIEFNILRLLMKNPGRIYSSAQIYELVWKEDSLGAETSVSVHIRHLRQKLEINPSEPRYLKVVWGLGYKMEDKK